ncbi:hypothetical protein EW026_g6182 [Hermanssonia centrifuga]|uniref:Uncharacterized protein n=1 Tax=Hermanssonia centrifuga TaxID=98765 RepID=A0A4S4KBV1_9APHY|nr:hypothetical protein EW026_g6182 [Hermanssonia centrifuga]
MSITRPYHASVKHAAQATPVDYEEDDLEEGEEVDEDEFFTGEEEEEEEHHTWLQGSVAAKFLLAGGTAGADLGGTSLSPKAPVRGIKAIASAVARIYAEGGVPAFFGLGMGCPWRRSYRKITRLQNSLGHLKRTQAELKEANEESPDEEWVKAMEENADVIGSQEERVSILRMALAEKGVHCAAGLTPQEATSLVTQPSDEQPAQATIRTNGTLATPVTEDIPIVDEDGGINL